LKGDKGGGFLSFRGGEGCSYKLKPHVTPTAPQGGNQNNSLLEEGLREV